MSRSAEGRMEYWSWPPRYDEAYRPPDDRPYWFPYRETMPPAEREAAILKLIR